MYKYGVILLLFFLDFAVSSGLKTGKVVKIGLRKARHNGVNILASIKAVRTLEATLEGNITLKDIQDLYYYGDMTLGTPEQTVTVLFDTGSADLWIPSVDMCNSFTTYCYYHNTYDHNESSTYKYVGTPFSITYGSGAVEGYISEDTVQVAGLEVTGQMFGEATQVDSDTASSIFDGILGLAYPALSSMKVNPPFTNMISQSVVDEPVFAFYLNKNSDSSSSGELILGGVDTDHYTGTLVYTPVLVKSYWVININGMHIGSEMLMTGSYAIPDSGTSLIYVPTVVMGYINERLRGTYDSDSGLYVVDCSTISSLPSVYFMINYKTFVLEPDDYIVQEFSEGKTVCISGFLGSDSFPFIILGDVFMRKYYTVFDMGENRVGFATACTNSSTTSCMNTVIDGGIPTPGISTTSSTDNSKATRPFFSALPPVLGLCCLLISQAVLHGH